MKYFKTEADEIRAIDDGQEFLVEDGWVEISESGAIDLIESMKPEPTQEEINAEYRAYLDSTDWYAVRKSETGENIPSEVLKARQDARDGIIE